MGCLSFLCPPRLASAELIVLRSANAGERIAIKFILRSYKLFEENIYAEPQVPGLSGTPLQSLRGQPKLLSITMYFDTRNSDRDVRLLTGDVTGLMNVDPDLRAPPVLRFEWKGLSFPCVLESATEEIISLFPDGRPARAKLHATFKEMRTAAELQQDGRLE